MDCQGRGCQAECEQRHLDLVEQERDGTWKWPERPQLIICAGPERSGSTWLYNAVRLLHRQARVPCDSYWLHTLSQAKLEERLKEGAHVCVKTHEWEPEYAELVRKYAQHVLLTHRDLQGVVASYRRVGWAFGIPRKYVEDHMKWKEICSLDIKYEDVVRDGEKELRALAVRLGIALPDGDFAEVHRNLKTLESFQRGGVDQAYAHKVTKMWPGHVSINTRRHQDEQDCKDQQLNPLDDAAYSEALVRQFPEFMSTYGYA